LPERLKQLQAGFKPEGFAGSIGAVVFRCGLGNAKRTRGANQIKYEQEIYAEGRLVKRTEEFPVTEAKADS
jgi:hypothetical protein